MIIIGILVVTSNVSFAIEINTGNENVKLRWDNSFRYNYGVRVNNQEDAIILNPNMDDGDRNFDKGTVTNRLDILSEMDLSYKSSYGFRVSGALWYDQRYYDSLGNQSQLTSNHIVAGQQVLGLPDETKKYHGGPDIELLDAFIFGKIDFGQVPLTVKVGRHTIYWGEALLFGGALNGLSFGQTPIDIGKAFSVPGSEVKELFRPLFNISAQMQLTETLTLMGQYFLQWESCRFPEAGSYLGNGDMLLKSAESLILAPGLYFPHGNDVEPTGKKNWGIAMKWSPSWFGEGKIGLYYRRTADVLPQVHVDLTTGEYLFAFAEGIDIYGISISKQILGISVGMEYSMRHNMPMQSGAIYIMTPGGRPNDGNTLGARGDTQHALINLLGLTGKTLFFDTSSWNAEINWCHWTKVTDGESFFLGRDGYNNIDKVTKNAVGISFNFSPTWYQVVPGADLSMPISYSRGIMGTSAIMLGDAIDAGNASVGFSVELYTKYIIALSYVKFFGDFDTDASGAVSYSRGSTATLRDRDMITFTFKVAL